MSGGSTEPAEGNLEPRRRVLRFVFWFLPAPDRFVRVAWALFGAVLAACADQPPAVQAPPAEPAPVSVAFGGDIHAEPPIEGVLARGDNPLADLAPTLTAADIAVVNVETAVGTTGTAADKSYTFQAPTSLWPTLVEAGVDVVNLANNHALDFGREGLAETIEGARAAGLRVVGAGANASEAYAPAILEVGGTTVAVVGLTRVMPVIEWAAGGRAPRTGLGLRRAGGRPGRRNRCGDGGPRGRHHPLGQRAGAVPADHQHELAAALTAAGADVIAGHHAHRLKGLEQRDGTIVAYGLGNLVFYASSAEATTTSLLTVTLDDQGPHDPVLVPARIDGEGSPRLLPPDEAAQVQQQVTALAPGAGTCPARS